jgi:hypothetical protein
MSGVYSFTWESPRTNHEHEVDVYYDYTPGSLEQGPTYDCGGVPAEGEEIEITRMVLSGMGAKGRDLSVLLTEKQVEDITDKISEHIEAASEPDCDYDDDDDRDYSRFYP